MGDAKKAESAKSAEGTKKRGIIKGVKTEFAKIIWPNKETIAKQSVAVIVITAILATFIGLLDTGIIQVLNKVLNIG